VELKTDCLKLKSETENLTLPYDVQDPIATWNGCSEEKT